MKEKMLKLYEDWEQSQNISVVRKARKELKASITNPAHFNKVGKIMGMDGPRFNKYFEESKTEFSNNVFSAKRQAAAFILEDKDIEIAKPITSLAVDNFKLAYEPVTGGGSNSMISHIEVGTPNGTATEILRAIVGGNIQLAAALTAAGWGRLSIGDRNSILNLSKIYGLYNVGSGVAKDRGETVYYDVEKKDGPIKNKGDVSKNEFVAMAFPMSDPSNTKIYGEK